MGTVKQRLRYPYPPKLADPNSNSETACFRSLWFNSVTWKSEAHNVGIGCASAILSMRKKKKKIETPFQIFNCLVVDAMLWLSAMKSERRARLLGCICRLHIGCCHQLLKVTGPVTAVGFNFIRASPAFKWGVLYGSPYCTHLKWKKPVYS